MTSRTLLHWLVMAIAVAVADSWPATLSAQPSESPAFRLTLSEAIDDALANAPVLAAASAREQAARLRATATERTRFGQVDGAAALTRFQDDVVVRPISRQLFEAGGFSALPFDRDQAVYGLTFQVPLYLGGRLSAAIDLARLQAEDAALALQGSRWDLRANVTAFYAAAQTADAVLRALDQNLDAVGATERSLGLMVEQGRRPGLDLFKLQAHLQEVRAERSRVAADGVRARALLLAAIGREPAAPVEIDPLSEPSGHGGPSTAELAALAGKGSSVWRAEHATRVAERGAAQARAALLPSVVARGNWLGHAAPSVSMLATWEVGVAVAVPLFDGGSRRAALASARASARAALSAQEQVRLERQALAVAVRAEFEATADQVRAAEAGLAAAAEAARIEQLRYDTGAGTIEDLLATRARELAAGAALARARGARIAAGARVNAVAEDEVIK